MLASLLAALALTAAPGAPQEAQAQTPPSEAVTLEDVTVTGRPLDSLIRQFVTEVAEPNRGWGMARWYSRLCVGAANLRAEPAQQLIDRVSTVAGDLGLDVGEPGCVPNVMIVATDDADTLTNALVEGHRRAFRMGGSGMDRGGAALRDFQNTSRPVRWWQMAMPVVADTGQRAVRIPGECTGDCTSPMNFAPIIPVHSASRIRTGIVSNLLRTIVIVDVTQVDHLTMRQLGDYIALVSLAQIDPDADTSAYSTILNVMDHPEAADSLTTWDTAYLNGLYGFERGKVNRRAERDDIGRSIRREHERLRAASAEETEN